MSAHTEQLIEREEDSARRAIAELRVSLDAAEKAIDTGGRVHSSVSGDPFFVAVALQLDAAIRARQLLHDVQRVAQPPVSVDEFSDLTRGPR